MAGKEPLMYSQFCYYILQDKQKRRATLHTPRKPGEQVEYAIDVYIIGELNDRSIGALSYEYPTLLMLCVISFFLQYSVKAFDVYYVI